MSTAETPVTRQAVVTLSRLVIGYWLSQAVYAAAKLGIADLLKDGPKSYKDLAKITGTHARSLARLLRVLVSIGVFAVDERGRCDLTAIGAYLQTEIPGSLRNWAIECGEEWSWRPWGELLYSVRTGKAAFDHVFGMGAFHYFSEYAEARALFDAVMADLTDLIAAAVVAAYDFAQFGTLVDVEGGYGKLIAAILHATSTLDGILFDVPSTIAEASKHIQTVGLAERCDTVGGDFFESVPSGGDAYLLSRIIHDWDEDRSIIILKNCHRAMRSQGKLLLVERVIPEHVERSVAHQALILGDLNMLVNTGGCERTAEEFRSLFAAAGFDLTQIIPTQSPLSVIEGVRASTESECP
jgi:hypothetical protein